jgi:serine/threonine-protein kinase
MVDEAGDKKELPERIGEYRVQKLLGEGGMGQVYLCHDEGLDRQVAVKVLMPSMAAETDSRERFLREARAMAKISSPHVVTVYRVVADEEAPHIVMELLDGEDVAERVHRDGAMPWPEAVDVTIDSVLGLLAAEEVGIVHRDVKPANLFLTPKGCKLTDFGLARPIDGSADLTQAGIVVGTPHYLAPELARGGGGTAASDVYALGATLYRMLTGHAPFDATAPLAVITQHITEPAPRLTDHDVVEVPAALSELVERMMAKKPDARPQDYDELLTLLRAVKDGAPLPAPSTAPDVTAPSAPPEFPSSPEADTMVKGEVSAAALAQTAVTPSPVQAEQSGQPERPLAKAPGSGRPPIGLIAGLFVGAIALMGLVMSLFGGGDLDEIDEGNAKAVLEKLDDKKDRSADEDLLRGHALAKEKRDTEAIAAYGAAAKKGASDERALDFLIMMLDDTKADDVIAALTAWPDDAADDRLRTLVRRGSWDERHHARKTLLARGKKVDDEAFYIRDLEDGETCQRRRFGLMRLKKVGQSDTAYAAVQRASRRMPDNLCMALDWAGALRALEDRD